MSDLIHRLTTRHGLPRLDAAGLDDFLSEGRISVLFFSGDPVKHGESGDVAVVLPELLHAFPILTGAVIAREAEAELAPRFGVLVYPTLVFLKGAKPLGIIPKVRNWSDYIARIQDLLNGAA